MCYTFSVGKCPSNIAQKKLAGKIAQNVALSIISLTFYVLLFFGLLLVVLVVLVVVVVVVISVF